MGLGGGGKVRDCVSCVNDGERLNEVEMAFEGGRGANFGENGWGEAGGFAHRQRWMDGWK